MRHTVNAEPTAARSVSSHKADRIDRPTLVTRQRRNLRDMSE